MPQIKFIAPKDYINSKVPYPEPIKLSVPDWYKKLTRHMDNDLKAMTVKMCLPFLDTLTSGYLLRIPQDFILRHNYTNEHGLKDTSFIGSYELDHIKNLSYPNLNCKEVPQRHHPIQLQDSSLVKKNKNLFFNKVLNPWIIITPPGYSCLFVPPLNNCDDRFEILAGIVDTDKYHRHINFPFVVNGDKYDILETKILCGTPYVQVIPFKREDWNMKIVEEDKNKSNSFLYYMASKFQNFYEKLIWSKKKWK